MSTTRRWGGCRTGRRGTGQANLAKATRRNSAEKSTIWWPGKTRVRGSCAPRQVARGDSGLCPACAKETFTKQVTAAGFQLKGSGWYVTDFKGGDNKPGAAKDEPAKEGDTKAAPAEGAPANPATAPAAPASATPAPTPPAAAPAPSAAPAGGAPSK